VCAAGKVFHWASPAVSGVCLVGGLVALYCLSSYSLITVLAFAALALGQQLQPLQTFFSLPHFFQQNRSAVSGNCICKCCKTSVEKLVFLMEEKQKI
jgi:hypothetical protein